MSSDTLYSNSSIDSLKIIENFWKDEVCSFKFSHCTSSLYREHFESNGISSTYPEAFKGVIDKIRGVWSAHLSVCEKRYFGYFEERYDAAIRSGKVAMSFTAKSDIIDEFTRGERKGGEWLREMNRVVYYAKQKGHLFVESEMALIQEMETFIQSINEKPMMLVKVSAGSAFWTPLLCPLDLFNRYVKGECADWEDQSILLDYIEGDLRPKISEHKKQILDEYEFSISQELSPEHLEFEILPGVTVATSGLLEFDIEVKLTLDQVSKLEIEWDGSSANPDYSDSRFTYSRTSDGFYIVTRRAL